MTNPHLLILDEATEGLAPLIAQEIWRSHPRHPRDRGIAAIIVDKNSLPFLLSPFVTLSSSKGRSFSAGASTELRQKPELLHQYARNLAEATSPPSRSCCDHERALERIGKFS
jgi:branched-chain amino acid transport system ATP-binding protein